MNVSKYDADLISFFGYDIYDNNPEIYQIMLHIEEGSPCCANYPLKRSGKDNSDKLEASTIENVPTFFYMDSFLKSLISEGKGKILCNQMMGIMKKGSSNLTKFKINFAEVPKALPSDEYDSSEQELIID